jgi:hypothetical protein
MERDFPIDDRPQKILTYNLYITTYLKNIIACYYITRNKEKGKENKKINKTLFSMQIGYS